MNAVCKQREDGRVVVLTTNLVRRHRQWKGEKEE